ncbi:MULTISPECIES: cysteine--tRNA ligase [Bradyrhizobium]|uniref:cysteine--tRNA ligase n=1 Tax=Bradyrhizobium TaxID=374 RepID=UPI001BA6996D|nr:cysteine--tRNA ligase [Bradyrhizobium liaoningense]MBR0984219.1 cysteine--tRNA ligase [Bradyrhizobium liaoningense]GMP07276.1 cysteine--tRNA ligase [Bradyrhizobium sp. TM239]
MELRLYDTLTKEKRTFVPLDAENVRMYVCGPTVYDFAHIGNARPVIVFDVLFRLLRHLYGEAHVKYVRNITDVDDKINDRAARDFPGLPLNEAIRKVTEQTGEQFHADVDALGALRPSVEPRATEHIVEMREIIERLVKGGFAYAAEDHVLFSPQAMNAANSSLPRYGALSNRSLDEMIAGARVDVAPYKKDNTDFVLWKPSKPGEPSWPSPAGIKAEGRPGWHIECSAMAWKHLGEHFDIHGGGIDLVFPHHENEVAQTCCAFHRERMANTWMHNGFLQVEGEKMSKSLGNFITIHELLKDWPGEVLRLNMLKTHYRSPIDWTMKALKESEKTLLEWHELLPSDGSWNSERRQKHPELLAALCDDLNTPKAIAELHGLRTAAVLTPGRDATALGDGLQLLGLFNGSNVATRVSKANLATHDAAKITQLIEERTAARARKDFKESDRIRDLLAAMGVAIKDSKDGTTWEFSR